MKFIKADKGKIQFSNQQDKEKRLLFQILRLFPLVPAAHAQISRSEDRAEDQQLLEESLVEYRKEQKKQVLRMLKAKSRFRPNKNGSLFSLKAAEVEWLLQVLNDVRVGSWLALGSPDGALEILAALNEKTAPYLWTMEAAGQFQIELLQSMSA